MSTLLTNQRSFLEHFLKAGLKQRKVLLQTITDVQLRALGEVIHNVLKGNVPLTTEQKRKLKRYRRILYVLADKTLKPSQKRKLIVGGANPIRYVLSLAFHHIPWQTNPS